jgi:hypothetical protein
MGMFRLITLWFYFNRLRIYKHYTLAPHDLANLRRQFITLKKEYNMNPMRTCQ